MSSKELYLHSSIEMNLDAAFPHKFDVSRRRAWDQGQIIHVIEYDEHRKQIVERDCSIATSSESLLKLLDQITEAKEILSFYADNSEKTNLYGKASSQFNSDFENYRILADKGSKARALLEKWK